MVEKCIINKSHENVLSFGNWAGWDDSVHRINHEQPKTIYLIENTCYIQKQEELQGTIDRLEENHKTVIEEYKQKLSTQEKEHQEEINKLKESYQNQLEEIEAKHQQDLQVYTKDVVHFFKACQSLRFLTYTASILTPFI